MEKRLRGKAVIPGTANGKALVSNQPLSFWGGYDAESGRLIDRRHDRHGELAAGRVLVFPYSKGSSTGSAVLLDALKRGTAPAAIITQKTDPIVALGAIIADELYGQSVPIIVLGEEFDTICDGDRLIINHDGPITIPV